MTNLQSDIHSSEWIYLYTRFQGNNRNMMFLLIANLLFITLYWGYASTETMERDLSFLLMGIWAPAIFYAFFMGFISFKCGRDIRTIATTNGVKVQEVKNAAAQIFRD